MQDSDELAAILSDDYTRAEFLRDRLVPKAVLFFTGEALEEDEEDVCCATLLYNGNFIFLSPSQPSPPLASLKKTLAVLMKMVVTRERIMMLK